MSSVFSSIFSNEEIQYLLQLPEVLSAKDRFGSSQKVQFTITLTDGIRSALQTRFGLDLSSVSEIPMRWIKGDTEAHVDRGSRSFENTYLVYLQDSEGEFILGTDSYPIAANTGFVFSEGTMHKTLNTGLTPRLLIGPMNEFAGPVGIPPVCFLEGTQILCLVDGVEKYVPIETMRAGTQVKTSCDGYKKVELIGKRIIMNPHDKERIEGRLYKLSPSKYPELKEDLFITGGHSILVDKITDKQREQLTAHLGQIFITDGKIRLTAMVDERAEPWASEGKYTIWHFALEHENIKMNYGVYANGLLVETCSINTMRTKSNLLIIS
jgi:hypothetical protein